MYCVSCGEPFIFYPWAHVEGSPLVCGECKAKLKVKERQHGENNLD